MKVNIKCKQTVEYDQIVEMTKKDFDLLNVAPFEVSRFHEQKEYDLVESYIDPRDVIDVGDEYTDLEVTICKV